MCNNKPLHLTVLLLIIFSSFCHPKLSHSEDQIEHPLDSIEEIPALPAILVEAPRIAPTTGAVIFDKQFIEDLPIRNGSVNELIGIVPGIQYSEEYNLSTAGGEIDSPPVAISGSRFYDNNYTIDGMSNTSILNPGQTSTSDARFLPGNPQKQLINPRMIEQVAVYHSNIPAEFGGFSGGQVNITLLDPSPEFWGQLSYRTTSDSWTKFYIDADEKEDFERAEDSEYQPRFTKQDLGFILNTPLSKDTAILTSYQKTLSNIKLNHTDGTKELRRERENILLKLGHEMPNRAHLTLTGIFSPTHASYAMDNISDSDYDIDQQTYSLNLNFEKEVASGTFYAQTGFAQQQISRDSSTDRYRWSADNFSGGIGDLEYGQDEWTASFSFELKPFDTGSVNHNIKAGFGASHTKLTYDRPNTSYYYYSYTEPTDTLTECRDDDQACISGSGYLSSRTAYPSLRENASSSRVELFLQDSMRWKRLELFPGVRVNRNTLTEDTNVAPRLSSSLDIFGDGSTIVFAGRNRYYSSTLIEQGHYSFLTQKRSSSSAAWETTNASHFISNDIEAPYADETTAGVIQKAFGGEFKAQYIHKKYRKEFASSYEKTTVTYTNDDGEEKNYTLTTYKLNNNGQSGYDSIQVSWHRNWKNQYYEINGTWQMSTWNSGNTLYYNDNILDEELNDTYWYDGKEYNFSEMPKLDYNRPTIINFIYRYELPFNTTFTNTTKYRGKYWRLKNTGYNPEGEREAPYVYEKVKAKSAITFDWSLSWQLPVYENTEVIVNLDVLNVFNKRNQQKYAINDYYYDIGRQFWLGIDVNF